MLERVWATIEEERETGYEHRAPKKKPVAAAGGGGGGIDALFKIVKLDTAILPTLETTATATTGELALAATATNMATFFNHTTRPTKSSKKPSDVLINCFKLDDLELDESKVN